jgi:pre-mRNA branch site protein p14
MPAKQDAAAAKAELARREEELAQLKQKHKATLFHQVTLAP